MTNNVRKPIHIMTKLKQELRAKEGPLKHEKESEKGTIKAPETRREPRRWRSPSKWDINSSGVDIGSGVANNRKFMKQIEHISGKRRENFRERAETVKERTRHKLNREY